MKKSILSLLAFAIGLTACSNNPDEETAEERIIPVETAEVVQEDLPITKEFYGRTSPETMVPVMAPAPGKIEELNVENGDQIKEGDILASVNPAESPSPLEIEAPREGRVMSLHVQEGGFISASEPIMTIVDFRSIIIELEVTADDLALFENREKASVVVEDADVEKEAEVHHLAKIPGETGLYTVELVMENTDNAIIPGMTAVVTITENTVEDTLIVPTSALVEETDHTIVYIVENEQVAEIPVTITEAQSERSAVEGELSEGDVVVVRGQLTLTDGSPVTVVEREEQ